MEKEVDQRKKGVSDGSYTKSGMGESRVKGVCDCCSARLLLAMRGKS